MSKHCNTQDFLQKIAYNKESSVINLRNLDLTAVNTSHLNIKNALYRITSMAANAAGDDIFCLDFTGSNISGLDFSNYNLTCLIFTEITAHKTIFTNSNLSDVRIDDADVRGADFRNTDLSYTKFFNTKINDANFASANLQKTYGLNLNDNTQEIVKRMGVASNIKNAIFPQQAQKMTLLIENEIQKHYPSYSVTNKTNVKTTNNQIKEFIFHKEECHQW